MGNEKPARKALGDWGERAASEYLEREGYRVIETNYRCQWGEVDLIVRKGGCVVFVEVRTRTGNAFGTPEESLTSRKQERLVATAQTYLQEVGLEDGEWRIDLITVRPGHQAGAPEIRHFANAVEHA